MRILWISLVFCIYILSPVLGQRNSSYAVNLIPDSLKENAQAVIQWEETRFTVTSPGKGTQYEKRVVTIFDKASDLHELVIYYDNFKKLGDVSVKIFDATGKFSRTISKKEWTDRSAIDNGTIYGDARVYYVDVIETQLPYTIEFQYEIIHKDIFMYPTWTVGAFNTALMAGRFSVTVPTDITLRHKTTQVNATFDYQQKNNIHSYVWEIDAFKPCVKEPMTPNLREFLPSIVVNSDKFEAESYTGSMKDWTSFGQFLGTLADGRDKISPELQQKVHELTDHLPTNKEKINVLYRYLQENTRYVSVQLGIGGWQPFEAEYVATNKFGDCKALSNFMKALLKEVGITSNLVVLFRGENPVIVQEDFTQNAFNHMLLYIPSEDYWLECTSTFDPPNYLGTDNHNRNVLLITDQGGKLTKTPEYTAETNTSHNTYNISFDASGSGLLSTNLQWKGQSQETYRAGQGYVNIERLKEYYINQQDVSAMTVQDFKMTFDSLQPTCTVTYNATLPTMVSVTGKRIFVPLIPVKEKAYIPPTNKHRIYPIYIETAYEVNDSFIFEIPSPYQIESVPTAPISLDSPFGKYELQAQVENQTMKVYRHLRINAGRFDASQYDAWRDFSKEVAKLNSAKGVFVEKKT